MFFILLNMYCYYYYYLFVCYYIVYHLGEKGGVSKMEHSVLGILIIIQNRPVLQEDMFV